jgi:hypothetical protein
MARKKVEFKFVATEDGAKVMVGNRTIGEIVTTYQAGGRHCFRLRIDKHLHPRMYRGRKQAAEALLQVDELVRDAKKSRWSPAVLVLQAWDKKVRSVERVD